MNFLFSLALFSLCYLVAHFAGDEIVLACVLYLLLLLINDRK